MNNNDGLRSLLAWITIFGTITVIDYDIVNDTIRAYIVTDQLGDIQKLFREKFEDKLSDDYYKYISGYYYFTIQFGTILK